MRNEKLLAYPIVAMLLIIAVLLAVLGCGGGATTTTTAAPTTTQTTAGGPGAGGAAPVRFVVQLTGAEVVPPVQTSASGTFQLFVEASPSGQFNVSYELDVKDITDVVAAHIHLGAKGVDGPVIVALFTGPEKSGSFTGVLAQGSILESALTGPMAGKTFADLTAAVLAGQTYVNIHTKAYPNGEIRGQIIVPTDSGSTGTTAAGAGPTTTSAAGGY